MVERSGSYGQLETSNKLCKWTKLDLNPCQQNKLARLWPVYIYNTISISWQIWSEKKNEAMKHINAMFLPISMGDGRKHTFFFLILVLAPIWVFKSSRADKNLVLKSFEKQTKKKCSSSCALWGGRHWFDRRVFMRLGRDRNLFWMINPLIFRRALLPQNPAQLQMGRSRLNFKFKLCRGNPRSNWGHCFGELGEFILQLMGEQVSISKLEPSYFLRKWIGV